MNVTSLSINEFKRNFKSNISHFTSVMIAVFLISVFLLLSDAFREQMSKEMKPQDEDVITVAFGDSDNALNYIALPILKSNMIEELKQSITNINSLTGVKIINPDKAYTKDGQIFLRSTLTGASEEYLQITGVRFAQGHFPSSENEIAVGALVAASRHLSINDYINIDYKGGKIPFKVVGILEEIPSQLFSTIPTAVNNMLLNNVENDIYRDLEYWYLQGRISQVSQLQDTKEQAEDILSRDSYISRNLENTGFSPLVVTQLDVIKMIDGWFVYINLFILLISVLSGAVSIVNIVNSMRLQIMKKTKDIALMRISGANKKQIISYFLLQNIVSGVLCSLLGVLIATVLIFVVCKIVSWSFVYHLAYTLIPVFVGIIMTVLSGYWVALKATKIDVNYALMKGN